MFITILNGGSELGGREDVQCCGGWNELRGAFAVVEEGPASSENYKMISNLNIENVIVK